MRKIPVEVLWSERNVVTVILPDGLDRIEVVGIVKTLLDQLCVPNAQIVVVPPAVPDATAS